MYPVTLTIHNEAQLTAVMQAIGANASPVVLGKTVTAAGGPGNLQNTEKAPAAPKSLATAASSKPGAAPQTTAPAAGAQEQSSDKVLDYEKDLKPSALAYLNKNNRDKYVAEVKRIGTETGNEAMVASGNIKDAKPEQYAALYALFTAAAEKAAA